MKRLAILLLFLSPTLALAQRGGSGAATKAQALLPDCTATTGSCPSDNYMCSDGNADVWKCDSPNTWTKLTSLGTSISPSEHADADYGDFTFATGVATLDSGVVAAAEMANADHGDVSWTSSVATVENLQCTNCVGTGDLDMTASYTFSGLNIFQSNTTFGDGTDTDYTITFDQAGTDYTFKWDDANVERTTITDGLFAFSAGLFLSNTGRANGFTWDAVETSMDAECTGLNAPHGCCTGAGTGTCDYDGAIFLGLDNTVISPGTSKDHIICTGFNIENCGGGAVDANAYTFKEQYEYTYDSSASAGPQWFVERNMNFEQAAALDPDCGGTCPNWRVEAFVLDTTTKSYAGSAEWKHRTQNSDRLVYWAEAGAGDDDDDNRVCVNCDPTAEASTIGGTFEARQLIDWASATTLPIIKASTDIQVPDDRSSQNFSSIDLDVDYSPTNNASDVGVLTGIDVALDVTGTATGVTANRLAGIAVNISTSQATGGFTVSNDISGLRMTMDTSGAAVTTNAAQYIDLQTPADAVDGAFDAIRIADLGGVGSTTDAIDIQAQSGFANGNLKFTGGEFGNGHILLDNSDPTHIWSYPNGSSDGATNILMVRRVTGSATANTDGNAVVTGTGSNLYGVMMWGDDTDTSTDTGTEVCALVGLTCVMAIENSDAEVVCGTSPTAVTASGYYRVLCK